MTSAQLINVLVGVLLPLLTALVTHRLASSRVKTLVLLALTTASAVATSVTAGFHWKDLALDFVIQYATAIVAHVGALKPAGVSGSNGLVATAVPGGIGAPPAVDLSSSREFGPMTRGSVATTAGVGSSQVSMTFGGAATRDFPADTGDDSGGTGE